MTPQSYRYMGTVGSHLNYLRTKYGAPTGSSAHDRASRKTHFESCLHADLAMFTNDTWHRVPCRSVSVSNFLCTSVLYNNYIRFCSVPFRVLYFPRLVYMWTAATLDWCGWYPWLLWLWLASFLGPFPPSPPEERPGTHFLHVCIIPSF